MRWAPTAAGSTSAGSPRRPPRPTKGRRPTRGSATSSTTATGSRSRTRSPSFGAEMIGARIWDTYKRWPVYSKFFDNLGPIPHHMHQNQEQAAKLGREGKPESYYFPPQLNWTGNNFPYTFFGLEPGTTKADLRRCLERWNQGDNGILDLSKAYRLKPGTGWLVPPGRPARPGLAGDLRAAVGLRRLRHVPVDGRGPARALGAAGQGRPRGTPPRPRLPRRAARLGEERRSRVQEAQLPRADRPRGRRAARATSTSGSSTARSTASSSSAPAS